MRAIYRVDTLRVDIQYGAICITACEFELYFNYERTKKLHIFPELRHGP